MIYVDDISVYNLIFSDKVEIESPELPIYTVQQRERWVFPEKWPLDGISDISESDVSRFACILLDLPIWHRQDHAYIKPICQGFCLFVEAWRGSNVANGASFSKIEIFFRWYFDPFFWEDNEYK